MENQSEERRYCPNCYYPMEPKASFCGNCGQKYTTGLVTIGELLQDFVESVLNIDSKIFRTVGALFNPGKLTNEYFKGKHKAYIAPLRIFFFMAVVHFAVISLTQIEALKFNMFNYGSDPQKAAYHDVFMDELDTAKQITLERFPGNPVVKTALDTLSAHIKDTRGDSIQAGFISFSNFEGKDINIARKDLVDMPLDTIFKRYKIEGWFAQLQVQQLIKLTIEGKNFSQFVLNQMVWMVILMMPALALILKLLYIRRKRYFVEHLIFSFHYHAFSFFVVSVAFLLTAAMGGEKYWPVAIAYSSLLPYLFIAMRRVYKQSRFKTFVKFTILNFSYLIIFVVFFVLAILVSALTF